MLLEDMAVQQMAELEAGQASGRNIVSSFVVRWSCTPSSTSFEAVPECTWMV